MVNYFILAFGGLTVIAGAIIVFRPDLIFGYFRRHLDALAIHILAIVVRMILGMALIVHAGESRFPATLEVLGWLSLTAAVVLGALGRIRFKRLMQWALSLGSSYGRSAGAVAVLFGGFLIYAVL